MCVCVCVRRYRCEKRLSGLPVAFNVLIQSSRILFSDLSDVASDQRRKKMIVFTKLP